MLKIMHRLVSFCGKYQGRIRASYPVSLLKGIMMKMPMFLCFAVITMFMDGTMNEKKCLYIGLALIASVILQAAFEHLCNKLLSAAGFLVFADKRMELGEHLRKLPMGYFTEGNMGKISAVLSNDMVFIEENCMAVLADMAAFIISQAIMLAMMFYMDVRIGVASLIVVAAYMLLGRGALRSTLMHSKIKQEDAQELTDAVLDFTEGIGIIKSYNMLGSKSKKLSEEFKKTSENCIRFEEEYTPWSAGFNLTYGLGSAAILGVALYLYLRGEMNGTYLMGMMLFLFDLFGSIRAYYSQMARLTVTEAALNRIEEVFAEAEMADAGTRQIPDTYEGPEISYEDVTFAYEEKDVLKHISFEANAGQMHALVGPSGGGKSTIASLLARLWDVKSGSIKIRGVDIRDVPMADLMNHISMVFQRVYLFRDSVYNNIAMGRPNATRDEVYAAAKKARCYDFIMALPDGFETILGEGGASLSGGEKQRISIARCILKDAPIIILDEATASVDADNESLIQEAISELVAGKTLIVIAHRLKTIRDAAGIYVISDGEIREQGTHSQLMEQGGIYASFIAKSRA